MTPGLQRQPVVAIYRDVVDEIGPARRTTGARTGGRSERVVTSILSAALSELARVGYDAFRLEDVATRAGVAKTTVYRRWPTKAELVGAAIRQAGAYDETLPDTGSIRSDMLAMVERAMELIDTPEGRAVTRMTTTDTTDPEIHALVRSLREEKRKNRARIVARAQERGELPNDVDPLLITEPVFSYAFTRLLRLGERLDRGTCERLIDLVITGAEHGAGKRASRPRRG